jgi:hypothetical protein
MKIVINEYPPYFLNLDAPNVGAAAVRVNGYEQWRFWCSHCLDWHYHGPGEGHRLAHCWVSTSPYLMTGYNLALSQGSES